MRVSEEPADHVRKLLQSTQSANSLSLEIIFAHDDPATDPIVLHVVPDPFIRVQIWRVRWQVKYFQASVRLVLGELFDLLRPVDRVAVYNEENLARDAVKQRLQEIDETASVHAALLHAETQFPARRYRRHHAY